MKSCMHKIIPNSMAWPSYYVVRTYAKPTRDAILPRAHLGGISIMVEYISDRRSIIIAYIYIIISL